ncbi:MAG: hypothetical protein ABFC80_03140 [Coriobacteriales bacterium]
MMRSTRARVVLVLLLGLVLGLPSVAHARVSEYQVQFMPLGNTGTTQLIVNAVVSQDTSLPATVQVPLPAGASVVWAGEILGNDPAQDPAREASVTAVPGGQLVTFTLTQSRLAQVEADFGAPTISGDTVTVPLTWVNTAEEGTYTFSVVFEAGAGDIKIDPAPVGEPVGNELGEKLYTLAPVRLAKGQSFTVHVTYTRGATDTSGGRANTPLVIALVALGSAVVALVVVLVRERSGKARAGQPGAPQSTHSELERRPEDEGFFFDE